jgi:ribosomal protein S27AE
MMAFVVHFSLVSSLNRYHPACAVKGPCVAVLACHSNRWACSGAGGNGGVLQRPSHRGFSLARR